METYDVPRPLNFQNGYEDSDQIPQYLNVGRTVETELRYIAMREEREERDRGVHNINITHDSTHRRRKEGTQRGNAKTSIGTAWLRLIVTVQAVTFLLAFLALVLGAVSIGKLRGGAGAGVGCGGEGSSSSAGTPLQQSPGACQVATVSQAVPVCFMNTTLCDGSTGECSVFYLPHNTTVSVTCDASHSAYQTRPLNTSLSTRLLFSTVRDNTSSTSTDDDSHTPTGIRCVCFHTDPPDTEVAGVLECTLSVHCVP